MEDIKKQLKTQEEAILLLMKQVTAQQEQLLRVAKLVEDLGTLLKQLTQVRKGDENYDNKG